MIDNNTKNDENIVRNKISIITFISSVLVIWIHAYNLNVYEINEKSEGMGLFVYYVEKIMSNFTLIAVPFFFIISGFLFFRKFEIKNIFSKYISRVRTILIPYIFWCSFYYFYFVILTNFPYLKEKMNTNTVELSLVGWINSLWKDEYLTLWFLQEIIIYIVLSPIIFYLLKNKAIGIISLIILLLLSNYIWNSVHIQGAFYYMLGAYIAINYKGIEYYKNRGMSYLSVAFIIGMLLTEFELLNKTICVSLLLLVISFFISVWFILDFFTIKNELPWWMKITFFTYVLHSAILEGLEKVVLIIGGKSNFWALIDYIFAPILVFLIIVIIAKICKNNFPTIWNISTGNR